MIYNLIIAAILIAAFFMCISAFILGIKAGKQLASGKIPEINLNPAKPILKAVEQYKETKKTADLQDELADIMNADRNTMINAIKKGV